MKKILIVNDNKAMGKLCQKILLYWKKEFVVETVESGEEALKILDSTFSLAITNLNMRGFDGLWLARKIKRKFNEKMPVIIMTSSISKGKIAKAKHAGASVFLSKRFVAGDFLLVVSRHLY
jgi:CheY-like chemotaxis protein